MLTCRLSGELSNWVLDPVGLGTRLENQGHVRSSASKCDYLLHSAPHHGSGRRDEEVVVVEFTARRGGGDGGRDLPQRVERGARSPGGVAALGFARTSHAMGIHTFDEQW